MGIQRSTLAGQETSTNITNGGCYLVARDPENDESARGRWQLTFFNTEIRLSLMRTNEQKLAYFIAKAIYYKSVMPLNDKKPQSIDQTRPSVTSMSTYFLKTVMMWTCEQHPPDDDFWSRDRINEAASSMLITLAECFEKTQIRKPFPTRHKLAR